MTRWKWQINAIWRLSLFISFDVDGTPGLVRAEAAPSFFILSHMPCYCDH